MMMYLWSMTVWADTFTPASPRRSYTYRRTSGLEQVRLGYEKLEKNGVRMWFKVVKIGFGKASRAIEQYLPSIRIQQNVEGMFDFAKFLRCSW